MINIRELFVLGVVYAALGGVFGLAGTDKGVTYYFVGFMSGMAFQSFKLCFYLWWQRRMGSTGHSR